MSSLHSWFHCNGCYTPFALQNNPQNQLCLAVPFLWTSCGHTICEGCMSKWNNSGYCPVCQEQCHLQHFQSAIPKECSIYFLPPSVKALEEYMSAWKFQQIQSNRWIHHLNLIIQRQKQILQKARVRITQLQEEQQRMYGLQRHTPNQSTNSSIKSIPQGGNVKNLVLGDQGNDGPAYYDVPYGAINSPCVRSDWKGQRVQELPPTPFQHPRRLGTPSTPSRNIQARFQGGSDQPLLPEPRRFRPLSTRPNTSSTFHGSNAPSPLLYGSNRGGGGGSNIVKEMEHLRQINNSSLRPR